MDKFKIDSHKLLYHVPRVNDWLDGKNIYPIYVEVSPIGACNHRCTYCGLDYMGYQPRSLETENLKKLLTEMGALGVKSIMYAGEGEPFLHKDMGALINHTKASGIDVAVTSNGVLFNKDLIRECLKSITWIKVSINALTPSVYAAVHKTKETDVEMVLDNISYAIEYRKEQNIDATVGMQMILLPENIDDAVPLAKKAREIGADYLVIKPYSQHLKSNTTQYKDFKYSDYMHLEEQLAAENRDDFNVVFRGHTMEKLEEKDRYKCCNALPFWSYIDAGGGLWACSAYLGDERFSLGNVMEDGFEKVWTSDRRTEVMKYVAEGLDTSECRVNCRMDEINRYLWELKNPPGHVNFI